MQKKVLNDEKLASRLNVSEAAMAHFNEAIRSLRSSSGVKNLFVRIHDEPDLVSGEMTAIGDYSCFVKDRYVFVEIDDGYGLTFVVSKKLLSKVAYVSVTFDKKDGVTVIFGYNFKTKKEPRKEFKIMEDKLHITPAAMRCLEEIKMKNSPSCSYCARNFKIKIHNKVLCQCGCGSMISIGGFYNHLRKDYEFIKKENITFVVAKSILAKVSRISFDFIEKDYDLILSFDDKKHVIKRRPQRSRLRR